MRRAQDLPIAQMTREHEGAAMAGHHAVEMLAAVHGDAGQEMIEGPAQHGAQLHDDEADMLAGAAAEPASLARGQLRERVLEIGQRHAATAGEGQIQEIAQTAAHPGGQRTGQVAQDPGHEAQEEADCFLRSRMISTTMGITDSTITITTMMWM
jgi:hypothetical protein